MQVGIDINRTTAVRRYATVNGALLPLRKLGFFRLTLLPNLHVLGTFMFCRVIVLQEKPQEALGLLSSMREFVWMEK